MVFYISHCLPDCSICLWAGRWSRGEDESGPKQEAGENDSRETECSVLLTSVKSEHVKTFNCEGSRSVLEP